MEDCDGRERLGDAADLEQTRRRDLAAASTVLVGSGGEVEILRIGGAA